MTQAQPGKPNCWDFMACGYGPDSTSPCVVVSDQDSEGTNGGTNGGRLCWSVGGTLSGERELAEGARTGNCLVCPFFHLVKSQEGPAFQLFKLARGVRDSEQLQQTIASVESLMAIHEGLRSDFDLGQTIRDITEEARRLTGAQRSVVLLLRGTSPALHGEMPLRGQTKSVVISLDEESAVGFAAVHNQIVNLHHIYGRQSPDGVPAFNPSYDRQCSCRTHSFLAVPINDPEDRAIGVITAANARKGFFSSDDEWFMEKYATEVALAVEKQKFVQQSVAVLRLGAIGETIAGLSHCIKNIAQALRAGSHVIKRALKTNNLQDVRAAWEIVDRHIEQLADLSMDVLAYDPVVQEPSKKTGLNPLVEHVVGLFREEARARAITLAFSPGADVETARFDHLGVYRCMVNLITNALDACPLSEGAVTVATQRTGEHEFMLSVADNGPGMDEQTKAAVFDLFHTSRPRRGAGLGLPTVADIVNRHNGRVEIDSRPGAGATLRIFIQENVAVV